MVKARDAAGSGVILLVCIKHYPEQLMSGGNTHCYRVLKGTRRVTLLASEILPPRFTFCLFLIPKVSQLYFCMCVSWRQKDQGPPEELPCLPLSAKSTNEEERLKLQAKA